MALPPKFQQELTANPELAARRAQYMPLVQQAAAKYGIPPGLLDFTLLQESRYKPGVVGDNGDSLGMAQIQPATARGLGIDPSQLTNPQVAIDGAAKYLSQMYAKSGGDWGLARLGYNRGPGAIDAEKAGKRLPTVGQIALNNMAGARAFQQAAGEEGVTPPATGASQAVVGGSAPTLEALRSTLNLPAPAQQPKSEPYTASPFDGNGNATPVESKTPSVRMPTNAFQPTPYRDWYAALGFRR